MSDERTPHEHRCPTVGCQERWICSRADCGYDDACEVCEQRRFETFAEAHGWTVAQPELPELALTAPEDRR